MLKKIALFCILLFPLTLSAQHKVLGVGNICIDYIQPIDEAFLSHISLPKRGWQECDAETFHQILKLAANYASPRIVSGGSACNTIKGLAELGVATAITGNLGHDNMGELALDVVGKLGITSLCSFSDTSPTCQIASLVTPDGERTFAAFNAAEKEITASDLRPKYFEGVELVHVEGYRLLNDTYVETSMGMGKKAGALISFDVCNPVYAEKYRERILGVVTEYVDILFLDRDEALALTQLPPEKACLFLKNYCDLVIVKVGADGCWVSYKGEVALYPAIPTEMVDSTGAGDLFASGFLYGFLNHAPLPECVQYGHLLGSTVIQYLGAEIPKEKWPSLREKMK